MKKFILFILFLFYSFFLNAQYINYSQFYSSPHSLNPALSGSGEFGRIGVIYRNQWPLIDNGYQFFTSWIDYNLAKSNFSFGINFSNEKVGINSLSTSHVSPSLSYDDSNKLYQEVQKDFEDESSNYRKFLKIKNNKHFNALQVKFSYAITCHKSQGGQWDTIFVEQPYLPNGIDKEYLRWLYTAVTRAKNKLYLIGFKDDFFVE